MTIMGNRVTADEGMWLVKDNVWAKYVFLGINDAAENWHEATQTEYEEAHPPEPTPPEEDATAEDYEVALAELSNDELKAILAELGISATMNKANMIKLILSMQGEANG